LTASRVTPWNVKRCRKPDPGKNVDAFSGSPKMKTFSQGILTLSRMKIVSF